MLSMVDHPAQGNKAPHERPGQGQHLLLAAREGAVLLIVPFREPWEEIVDPFENPGFPHPRE